MTGFFGGVAVVWATSIAILGFVVGWILAAAVYRDAVRLEKQGLRTTILVAPWVWAVLTFIGGVVPAIAYWLMHHGLVAGELKIGVGGYVREGPGGETAQ